MSGGSFNYFCFKRGGEQLDNLADLKAIEEYCREQGQHLAADELFRYLLFLETMKHRMDAYQDRMQDLLQSVEWSASGDSNPAIAIPYSYEKLLEGIKKAGGND